ncbi:MAG: hypothetical protein IT463_09780, partial [Planctomycetes bacterium]|nr:hypothetical protein [Planctomycetota bacterium]
MRVLLCLIGLLALGLGLPALCGQTYTASSIANAYSTYDVSATGTNITGSWSSRDDGNQSVTMPFAFTFFGQTPFITPYTLRICTNGWVSQTATTADRATPATLPSTAAPNGFIAAFFRDLSFGTTAAPLGNAYTHTIGAAPNRAFVVQFADTRVFGATATTSVSFSIVLFETTNVVEIHYGTMTTLTYTGGVGLENSTGTHGIASPAGFNIAPVTSAAYRWTPADAAVLTVTNNMGTSTGQGIYAGDAGAGGNGTKGAGHVVVANTSSTLAGSLISLTFTANGTGNDAAAYSELALYRDANGNTTYESGTDVLVQSTTAFGADNGTATFAMSSGLLIPASSNATFFVVAKFAGTSPNWPNSGTTFLYRCSSIAVASSTVVGLVNATNCSGFVITSPHATLADTSPAAQVGCQTGATNQVAGSFSVAYPNGPTVNLATVTIGLTFGAGGATTHVTRLDIFTDSNGNNQIDGTDASVGNTTTIAASNAVTINQSLAAGSTTRFLIVLSFNATAPTNATYQGQVTAATWNYTTVTNAGLPTTLSAGLIIQVNNDLNVTRNGPGTSTAVDNDAQGTGNAGLVILDFSLKTNQAAWTVTDITFTESGTADGSTDINFLALYEDSTTGGTAGSFDAADALATAAAGTAFSAANGTYAATLSTSAWAVSTTRRFFLVCKLSGQATAGETIQAEVTALTATTAATPAATTGVPTTAANTALTIDVPKLTVALAGPGAYTAVNNDAQGPNNDGLVLAEVTLTTKNDQFNFTSLTFTASG